MNPHPEEWAATRHRPGVNLLADASAETARRIAREMTDAARRGDVIVASIHWGGNWGYWIRPEETLFARSLIDHGTHVLHGHSSHHVKTIELHKGRPLLDGCGDFLNDCEGMGGYEGYRPDLALIYLVDLHPSGNHPAILRMLPMRIRRFRLERASRKDARWLAALLNRPGESSGTEVEVAHDNTLAARAAT